MLEAAESPIFRTRGRHKSLETLFVTLRLPKTSPRLARAGVGWGDMKCHG